MSGNYGDPASQVAAALARMDIPARGPRPELLIASLTATADIGRCWPWLGSVTRNGYGRTRKPGTRRSTTTAHRAVYELMWGRVPDDLEVDHICHDPDECFASPCDHRRCVNPWHLSAVTHRENVLRSNSPAAVNLAKSECRKGHEFTPENTYIDPAGRRACRTCQRAHWRRYDAARRAS